MWRFSKESGVDLDLPELHRRKLIKFPERENEISKEITKDGFFDFSNSTQSQVNKNSENINQTNNPPVADFLSDFASIGASNPNVTPTINQAENTSKKEDSEDFKDLKWRIENIEFKLEQLLDRLNSLNK